MTDLDHVDGLTVSARRRALLAELAAMPDEAFGYVVLAVKDVVVRNEANHGFTKASTASFVWLATLVNDYVGGPLIDMAVLRSHNPTLFDDQGRVIRG